MSLPRIFHDLEPGGASGTPICSLIAFKACIDLGLGPHPIHRVEQFRSSCVCQNNSYLQGTRRRGSV